MSTNTKVVSQFTVPSLHNTISISRCRSLQISKVHSSSSKRKIHWQEKKFLFQFASRKGCDVLVEALEREGVTVVFGSPGGTSMEIHQALTRSNTIRNVLLQHEWDGVSAAAAEGYARVSNFPGVCMGTTNLVPGLADALRHSVPLVAITCAPPQKNETRPITKHNYLVLDIKDIPRIVKEAFFIAMSGRPGPVLIHIPEDVQQQMVVPDWHQPMRLDWYLSSLPKPPNEMSLEQIIRFISGSKKPLLYVGGGCLNSSEELRRFVKLTGIPVASTLMGIGSYHGSDEQFAFALLMQGMHGIANYAMDKSDLLLAFGVRFDDRVTGKLEDFTIPAKIVHIDHFESADIGKNKLPHVSICADLKLALEGLNSILEEKARGGEVNLDFVGWRQELKEQKIKYPLTFGDDVPPECAIQMVDEVTGGKAIISTGFGQHQMWAAEFYKYNTARQWLTLGGLGAMEFGLPAAIGAAVARPDAVVVYIDGERRSFIRRELDTIREEKVHVKIMFLNNQNLGEDCNFYKVANQNLVEDRFYEANQNWVENLLLHTYIGHTYLGNPVAFPNISMLKFAKAAAARVTKKEELKKAIQNINMLKFAEALGIPAARVTKKEELKNAIQKMLDTSGPYILDVIVPY